MLFTASRARNDLSITVLKFKGKAKVILPYTCISSSNLPNFKNIIFGEVGKKVLHLTCFEIIQLKHDHHQQTCTSGDLRVAVLIFFSGCLVGDIDGVAGNGLFSLEW